MKKQILFLLVVALLMGCASSSSGSSGGNISSLSDVIGKELKLVEVQIDSTPFNRIVIYDREDLKKHKHDVYTLTFTSNAISGTAAPNKYNAPYTRSNKNLTIKPMRSTQMAPLVQPEKLQENDFYNYMQKVESWDTDNGRLVLKSTTDDGIAVRLIFAL